MRSKAKEGPGGAHRKTRHSAGTPAADQRQSLAFNQLLARLDAGIEEEQARMERVLAALT